MSPHAPLKVAIVLGLTAQGTVEARGAEVPVVGRIASPSPTWTSEANLANTVALSPLWLVMARYNNRHQKRCRPIFLCHVRGNFVVNWGEHLSVEASQDPLHLNGCPITGPARSRDAAFSERPGDAASGRDARGFDLADRWL